MRPLFAALAIALLTACPKIEDTAEPGETGDTEDTAPVDADEDGSPVDEDCDDDDPARFPGADELCNGIDDDCDGDVDEDATDASTWYPDDDEDGFGDADDPGAVGCTGAAGTVEDATDCDDGDPAVNPDGVEVCNGADDDCDDEVDEDPTDAPSWYPDADGDGFGDEAAAVVACDAPKAHIEPGGDCDDANAEVFPGAEELCDDVDSDCDGALDDPDAVDPTTWYLDADGDGYGDDAISLDACDPPTGYVDAGGDCDDADPAVGPLLDRYLDADGDGYGRDDDAILSCTPLSGRVDAGGDCDDADPARNPETVWYEDADGDGFGDDAVTAVQCEPPDVGWELTGGDCAPADPTSWPGAAEICFLDDGSPEGADNDCDGDVDEECPVPHCGLIAADEVWSPAPYGHLVTCDVEVEGAVLTIEDAVDVAFYDGTAIRVGYADPAALVVDGSATGVTLAPFNPSPVPGVWEGVAIGEFDTGSSIVGVTSSYPRVGLTLEMSSPEVDGWVGTAFLDAGIEATGGAPVLRAVELTDGEGHALLLDDTTATVEGLVIRRVPDAGIDILDGDNTLYDVVLEDVYRDGAFPYTIDARTSALTIAGLEVYGGAGPALSVLSSADGGVFEVSDVVVEATTGAGLSILDYPFVDTQVTIDGATVTGGPGDGVYVWCSGDSRVTLRDIVANDTGNRGVTVDLDDTSQVVVEGLEASGNRDFGLYLILYTDDGAAEVRDVILNDNSSFGLAITAVFSTVDLLVERVTAERNGNDGISFGASGADVIAVFDQVAARDNRGDGFFIDNGEDGTTLLTNIVSTGNTEEGVYQFADGFVEILGADISNNGRRGVNLDDGELALVDATLIGNGTAGTYSGIRVDTYAKFTGFAGNTVSGSSEYPYNGDDFDSLGVLGNDSYDGVFYGRSDFTGNATDVIYVTHSGTGGDLVVQDPGVPIYLLDGLYSYGRSISFLDVEVYVAADEYIIIDDGYFGEAGVEVSGSYFGPLDPVAGWKGLYAGSGSYGAIHDNVIEGSSLDNVRVDDTRVEVFDNELRDADGYGVYCKDGCAAGYTVYGNVFSGNAAGDTN